jgi:hypothetical protein
MSSPLRRLHNGLINGIFETKEELLHYQKELERASPEIAVDETGFPILPTCLNRRQ